MPTGKKEEGAEEETTRKSVRRSTRASSAQPSAAAAASPVRTRKSTASAPPKKSDSSEAVDEEPEPRSVRRSMRASSAQPTSAAEKKSIASATSSKRSASSVAKNDDASVGTPRRARRASSVPAVVASPVRLTRRSAAALAALESNDPENISPSQLEPLTEDESDAATDQKLKSETPSTKVSSQTTNIETVQKQSPSSRIPVHSSKLPTPNKQSPSTRSSLSDRVDSPTQESLSIKAAIEASRVTTPTMNRESRSGSSTPTNAAPGSVNSPLGQSPSTRARSRVSTPTQQSPSAIPSPSGLSSTPSRRFSTRSRSSTPTHSPDTRASVKSHKKCCTPPTQSPERSSARSRIRSTGSNRSTPTHSPVARSALPRDALEANVKEVETAVAECRTASEVKSPLPAKEGKNNQPSTSEVEKVESAIADGRTACVAKPSSPSKKTEINQSPTSEVKESESGIADSREKSPSKKTEINQSPTSEMKELESASQPSSPSKKTEINQSPTSEVKELENAVKPSSPSKKTEINQSPTSEVKDLESAAKPSSPSKKTEINKSPTSKVKELETAVADSREKSPYKKAEINQFPTTKVKEVGSAVADGLIADEAKSPSPSKKTGINQAGPVERKNHRESPAEDPVPEGTALPEMAEQAASKALGKGPELLDRKPVSQTTMESNDAPSKVDVSDPDLESSEIELVVREADLSTILEGGSEDQSEESDVGDEERKQEVILAAKTGRKPDTDGARSAKHVNEDTDLKEVASSVGSQSGLSKLCKRTTSSDLRIDVSRNVSMQRLLTAEGIAATPEDHGICNVKLTPPKRKRSKSVSPRRLDFEINEDGTNKSQKRNLEDDFLAADETDLASKTPESGPVTAKTRCLSTAKALTPRSELSELTKCVSPLKEGKASPVPMLANNPVVSSLLESEKSPRQREGSPIVESGAPESPEVSPIFSTAKVECSSEISAPKILTESRESEKSPGDRSIDSTNASSPKMTITTNPEKSSDLHSHESSATRNTEHATANPENSTDAGSPEITTETINEKASLESTVNPTAENSIDTGSPEIAITNFEDSCNAGCKDTPTNPPKDSPAARDHPPEMPIYEEIVAFDEESVDSGNASEEEEKRKIRAVQERSPIENNQPSDVTVPDTIGSARKPVQSPLKQAESAHVTLTEAESDHTEKSRSPVKAELKTNPTETDSANDQVDSEPPTKPVEPEIEAEQENAAESKDEDISFGRRKSLGLNLTRYSTLPLESSGEEDEMSEESEDEDSVCCGDGDESSHSDEELLDVSTFAPKERSRRVSFLEQSCIIISDDEKESSNISEISNVVDEPTEEKAQDCEMVGNVSKFLVVDSSPARACTPGKVKDLIAKLNGGEKPADGVVASSSAVGFVARDAPATPAGAKPRANFASSTASEFVVEEDADLANKGGIERTSKRKADEGNLNRPPTKVSRPNLEDSTSGPHRVVVSNIPKDTALAQLKSALKQLGIAVGLDSVRFAQTEGDQEMKTAIASYNSMKNALNAVSASAKMKLNGQKIFLLMEEGHINPIREIPATTKKTTSPQKKFCGIVSNLPVNTTISDIMAAFEKLAVKNISQVKIFRMKSHNDSVFAKIKFCKKTALLKAIVVSENIEIRGRKIEMKIKQQSTTS